MFRKKMLISRVDPSSFSPEVELVGLLTAASYKGLFPGSGQPTAPSCFLRHQPHSPASAASGFSTFCQQSKARKQCVQAVYRRPGPGSLWGNQTMAVRDVYASKRKAAGYMSQRLCDLLQRLYRHVAQVVWSRN